MNASNPALSQQLKIDATCVRFEEQLRAGERPRIESLLDGHEEPFRSTLLRHLLSVEFEFLEQHQQPIELFEFLRRFAQDQALVQSVFSEHIARRGSIIRETHPHVGGQQPRPEVTPHDSQGSASGLSDSSHHGRFLPGTKVADRYRIVSLLGKGGMGEVYRADDLKLGQTVALKFLPDQLATDEKRLEYFHEEVRLTRQISHPNVCRVYDIGEVDGQYFLSMEYIDGEDLKILLRRIGRLPRDKGIQIAQQLCAGLAAAHDKGVLHRDLKPANIMIDGRGQVRITDFGLAKLVGEAGDVEIVGTPAYMAPEQLTRGETTIQSDLYALGLILYELFTGEAVNKAASIPELLTRHEDSSPSAPSSLVGDMDPVVERAILRCLENEPHERPGSAHAVAASLPGGDPLAAALAAGETPSPEMIAAAGGVGGLDPKVAGALLAAVVVGLGIVLWLSDATHIVNLAGLEKHPRELVSDAREIIKLFGYEDPPLDTAWEFAEDYDCFRYLRESHPSGLRGSDLSKGQPPVVFFWYRHSPVYLEPERFFTGEIARLGEVTVNDPANHTSGMITMRLDTQGRLIEFQAEPKQRLEGDSFVERDCLAVLQEHSEEIFGFSLRDFDKTESEWSPPSAFDDSAAWEGAYPNGIPIRVEAADFRGKLVYVHVIGEWTRAERETGRWGFEFRETDSSQINAVMSMVLVPIALLVCFYNHRTGRGDRRGAFRLALFIASSIFLVWLLADAHMPDLVGESKQQWAILAWCSYFAVWMWLYYFAIEPFIRRVWPRTMIAWSRLLAGRWRDPLIGRHLLIGILFGVVCAILLQLRVARHGLQWQQEVIPTMLAALLGTQRTIWGMLLAPLNAVIVSLSFFFVLLLVTLALRKRWLAVAAFYAFFILHTPDILTQPTELIITNFVVSALIVFMMIRYGVLAATVWFITLWFLQFPITTDASKWYFGTGLSALGVILALAAFGCYTSLGRTSSPDRFVIVS